MSTNLTMQPVETCRIKGRSEKSKQKLKKTSKTQAFIAQISLYLFQGYLAVGSSWCPSAKYPKINNAIFSNIAL